MEPLFPKNFPFEILWKDPLEKERNEGAPGSFVGAILRAEVIERYVRDFNLIVDNSGFERERVKGASYSMRPAPHDGWIVDEFGAIKSLTIETDGANREWYIAPKNSFVFIRLAELLRLPFYMIARFNLKIRYVYQGLLLGTGPQIDPGYAGRIFIPLHNLTSEPVSIYTDETFVSFDFELTTPLELDKGDPSNRDEFYKIYLDSKRPIDRAKLERQALRDYLGESKPHSSLEVLQNELKALSEGAKQNVQIMQTAQTDVYRVLGEVRSEHNRTRWIELGALLAFLVAVVAIVVAFNQIFHDDLLATRGRVDELSAKVDKSGSDAETEFNRALDSRLADSQRETKKILEDIATQRKELERVSKENEVLKKQIEALLKQNRDQRKQPR
jgi:Deoxycytidine deaminase